MNVPELLAPPTSFAPQLQEYVDSVIASKQDDGLGYISLGPSILDKECDRASWYSWRWYSQTQHEARILRLFSRGHGEEDRVAEYLHQAGIEIQTRDPDTNDQFGIRTEDGHFRGYSDGRVVIPGYAPGNFECKTMNDKNFARLLKDGIPQGHVDQMQLYMKFLELPWTLYVAVNKNTDAWHFACVAYDEKRAEHALTRIKTVMNARTPPFRLNESPAYWVCKMCDHHAVCHKNAPVIKSCRSCKHGRPVQDGKWECAVTPSYAIKDAYELRDKGESRIHMPCKGLQWELIE